MISELILYVLDLLDRAFSKFSNPEIAPIAKLKDGLNIMELFHGKTWAFKDLALSCVGQFLEYFLSRKKKHVTIVVGKYSILKSFIVLAHRNNSLQIGIISHSEAIMDFNWSGPY